MKQEIKSITVRNIIDIIDGIVIELKSIRNGSEFKEPLKLKIKNLLQFLKNINNSRSEEIFFDKNLYAEHVPFVSIQINSKDINVNLDQINRVEELVKSNELTTSETTILQHSLVELSILLYPSINNSKNEK